MACDSPFYVSSRDGYRDVPVPCGRCPPCKKRRVDGWVFRLMQEEKVSLSAHFVTLTYDNKFVPISPHGFMTLSKGYDIVIKDGKQKKIDRCCFTKYMKRLRKLCPGRNLKYYVAGEYGPDNLRPHWHAIIFNVPNDKYFFDAWSKDGVSMGSVVVGQVTGNSIAYCMKYIDKEGALPLFKGWTPYVGRDDRVPEFALMSKGLGANYVTDAIKKYHQADHTRLFLTLDGGFKIAMPRYYRQLIFSEEDIAHQLGLIQSEVAKNVAKDEKYYQKMFAGNPGFTYTDFVISKRKARYNSFYAKQKKRNAC